MKKALIIGVLCCVVLSGTVTAASLTFEPQQPPGHDDTADKATGETNHRVQSITPLASAATAEQEPEYEVTVSRIEDNPNQVRFTVTITDTKSLENLQLELSDGNNGAVYADSTNGFQESGVSVGRVYEWDSETETPSLTIIQSVPRNNDGLSTNDAVIVETPQISISSSDIVIGEGDGYQEIYSEIILGLGPRTIAGTDGTPGGVATRALTAVGDVTLNRVSRNGTQFWVTEAGDATVNATNLATMMGASQQYLAGSRPSEVSVFAVGDEFRLELGAGFSNIFDPVMVVSADEPIIGPGNTWLHEYVHVQQSPISTSRESNWWIEAIAEYQTARIAPAVTNTSPAESYYHLIQGAANTAPLREASHPTVESSYERGSFVLLCLSLQIAEASNGNKTVQDVIKNLYESDYYSSEKITRTVANQSNESVSRWFENAVRSPELPEEPSYQEYLALSSRPPAQNPKPRLTTEPTATPTPTTTSTSTTTTPTTTGQITATQTQTNSQTGGFTPFVTILAITILSIIILLRRE